MIRNLSSKIVLLSTACDRVVLSTFSNGQNLMMLTSSILSLKHYDYTKVGSKVDRNPFDVCQLVGDHFTGDKDTGQSISLPLCWKFSDYAYVTDST